MVPAHAVVYVFKDDLWRYDLEADSVRRITADGQATYETSPRFRDAKTVTFIGSGKIFDLDLSTGRATPLLEADESVHAFDWSPDGRTLALLTGDPAVVLFTPADEKAKTIRQLPDCPGCGRGGSDKDEDRIEWSSDGSQLLVLNTGYDNDDNPTMWVLDLEGRDIVAPRDGTHARWSKDSKTIFYEPWNYEPGLKDKLRAVDIRTRKTTTLPIASVYRPSLSPDGRFIAYDDGEGHASVFIYDIRSRTTRRLAEDAVAALWLSPDSLAVTQVRPCKGDECGHAPQWFGRAKVEKVTLSGSQTPLSMRQSIDADVLNT